VLAVGAGPRLVAVGTCSGCDVGESAEEQVGMYAARTRVSQSVA
jgi:hypothetical protein